MTCNVGGIDRVVRAIVGLGLIAWALGLIPNVAPSVWGWIGLVPLGTALIGWCPPYALLGINTCAKK